MRLNRLVLFGITFVLCGNTFAYSPYANTIKQNISQKSFLDVASFPQTAADATFVERVENKAEGYRPYFNRSAFAGMTIEEQDELESMAYRAEIQRLIHCKNHPTDTVCNNNATTTTTTYTSNQSPSESIYPTTPPQPTTPSQQSTYMRAALTSENIARYNLKTHNGGCTPPERSNHWRNDIQTTGQYMYSEPAFEKFMITAFRKEGGCGLHPNDRGGYTCYGCASNGLCSGVDFNTITRGKVETLAYNKMYKQYNVDKLPDAFRGYAMWGIWGSGPITGIKQFQGTLGVPLTGKIDNATISAAETYTGDFAIAYTNNREQFLRNIVDRDPSQAVFLNGWLNALNLLRPSGCHVIPISPIYR